MLVENIDTRHLIDLNNQLITQVNLGKPHARNETKKLLEQVKCELIKRDVTSKYVLDYQGRL